MMFIPHPKKKKERKQNLTRVCYYYYYLLIIKFYAYQELNVPEKDVEQLLVSLILDNRIDGHIDQVNRLLERGDRYVLC